MSDLLEKIRTQDNRYTKLPIYYVIKRKRWAACWEEQCDKHIWVDGEGREFHKFDELIDHLIEYEHMEKSKRKEFAPFDELDDLEDFGISRVPVKYEEYESEFDPIFLTEESAKRFCENDRDKTAITYVKHAGREFGELIGLAERAEKSEAENARLRNIIFQEGQKWENHHDRPDKKKYWADFKALSELEKKS